MDSESDLIIANMNKKVKKEMDAYFQRTLETSEIRINIEKGCRHGNNFIGIVYRVSGYRLQRSGEVEHVKNLFLKIAPDNRIRRERFHVRANFLREIFVYNEVTSDTI